MKGGNLPWHAWLPRQCFSFLNVKIDFLLQHLSFKILTLQSCLLQVFDNITLDNRRSLVKSGNSPFIVLKISFKLFKLNTQSSNFF